MNHLLFWLTNIGTLAIFGFGLAYSKPANDEEEIRALEQNFKTAVQARDVAQIMANYEHSDKLVVFDVHPPRQYVGWDAYRKDWQDFLSKMNGPVAFEISDLSITASGNLAYGHSFQHLTGQTKDGKVVDDKVRVTDVYQKMDGKWLIVHEHVSVPVDLSAGKPSPQGEP
jgi:ketosteroid isomerase-like protein